MNIEAYDADSLRKMVRLLEYENKILKDKLKKAGISYEEVNPFEEKIESAEEYDLDQGNRIVNPPYITEKMAIRFFSMFWGREDIYARRGKNGGYFPQCANRWNDRLCPKQREYYGAAEPPVRCGESHLSGLTEPPQFVYLVTLPLLDPVHILLS